MHTGASFRSAPRSYFRMIPRLYAELIAYECATSARCRSRTLDRFPRRRLTHPSPTMPTPITAENKSRNEFTAPGRPAGAAAAPAAALLTQAEGWSCRRVPSTCVPIHSAIGDGMRSPAPSTQASPKRSRTSSTTSRTSSSPTRSRSWSRAKCSRETSESLVAPRKGSRSSRLSE